MFQLEKIVFSSLRSAGVEEGAVLLAAVSGGADSTAMLAALAALRGEGGFRLHALHIDHGLRGGESRADAAAAAALCESLDVPCRVVTAATGLIEREARRTGRGIEAAARDFRHARLREEADRLGACFILVAHTRDDMLENTLLRILRGAGPAGLAAMPERNGRVLRPLITARRAGITAYLNERGLSWREDSSNADERYLRNRVRRRLVPLLDEHFPEWRQSVTALAETQSVTAEFLAEEAARRIVWEESAGGGLRCVLDRFAAESQIIREEAFFLACDRITAKQNGDGGDEADLPPPPSPPPRRAAVRDFARKIARSFGDVEFEACNGAVTATPSKQRPLEECASILIDGPGVYRLGNIAIDCIPVSGGSYRLMVSLRSNGMI
ncbi:MAG: tRNA lysidine(34) synthetase TilS [Spirochaetaceae bacterium]|nr:tRNA lysidine(34) synthetase TilS [Spirochaetaceae bacterium]